MAFDRAKRKEEIPANRPILREDTAPEGISRTLKTILDSLRADEEKS